MPANAIEMNENANGWTSAGFLHLFDFHWDWRPIFILLSVHAFHFHFQQMVWIKIYWMSSGQNLMIFRQKHACIFFQLHFVHILFLIQYYDVFLRITWEAYKGFLTILVTCLFIFSFSVHLLSNSVNKSRLHCAVRAPLSISSRQRNKAAAAYFTKYSFHSLSSSASACSLMLELKNSFNKNNHFKEMLPTLFSILTAS